MHLPPGRGRAAASLPPLTPRPCGLPASIRPWTVTWTSGWTISSVLAAQFGILTGSCYGGFEPGGCVANASVVKAVVETQPVDKRKCTVPSSLSWPPTNCTATCALAK